MIRSRCGFARAASIANSCSPFEGQPFCFTCKKYLTYETKSIQKFGRPVFVRCGILQASPRACFRGFLISSRKSPSMELSTVLRTTVLALTLLFPGLGLAQPASSLPPAITGISHITLFADDIAKSQKFYVDLL